MWNLKGNDWFLSKLKLRIKSIKKRRPSELHFSQHLLEVGMVWTKWWVSVLNEWMEFQGLMVWCKRKLVL